ncbi:MAG: putative quinol monooxygenase [Acidimicrobiia bacterium]
MSSEVFWIFEITLKPGAVDQFTALAKEMVDANAAGEPDTLAYEVFITADGTRVHFCERFVDSAAVMAHVARFGENFAARVLELAAVTRFEIYGDPSAEVKATLADLNPTYLTRVAGFTR